MSITLKSVIEGKTKVLFNEYVYNLIDIFSLEEVCCHINKSKFINIVLLKKLYTSILNNPHLNTNLILNNLFIKVIMHNIGKEIPEREVYNIIKDINTEKFNNHVCDTNNHTFSEDTCDFSIYTSFEMCLYHYLNDNNINYNSYISEYFVRRFLLPETYQSFKTNTVYVLSGSNKTHYLEEKFSNSDRYKSLNSVQNNKKKLSINNSLLWDNPLPNQLDITYLFLNDFKKQVHIIRADSIVYYNSIYKIYNWLYWCYWNPNSPFRKKKLSKEYDVFTGV